MWSNSLASDSWRRLLCLSPTLFYSNKFGRAVQLLANLQQAVSPTLSQLEGNLTSQSLSVFPNLYVDVHPASLADLVTHLSSQVTRHGSGSVAGSASAKQLLMAGSATAKQLPGPVMVAPTFRRRLPKTNACLTTQLKSTANSLVVEDTTPCTNTWSVACGQAACPSA